ncbi:hypothetical protein DFJ74DRAFT_753453 [Hyaloraphidium curvatum]|nr:hypothetical protein DFJ74DRAFT_753453 [Hyaloraphidium curvatum]
MASKFENPDAVLLERAHGVGKMRLAQWFVRKDPNGKLSRLESLFVTDLENATFDGGKTVVSGLYKVEVERSASDLRPRPAALRTSGAGVARQAAPSVPDLWQADWEIWPACRGGACVRQARKLMKKFYGEQDEGGSGLTRGCSRCGKLGQSVTGGRGDAEATIRRCGRCKSTSYCSVECQGADWPSHKDKCKPKN